VTSLPGRSQPAWSPYRGQPAARCTFNTPCQQHAITFPPIHAGTKSPARHPALL
jgi:hypothetical protein